MLIPISSFKTLTGTNAIGSPSGAGLKKIPSSSLLICSPMWLQVLLVAKKQGSLPGRFTSRRRKRPGIAQGGVAISVCSLVPDTKPSGHYGGFVDYA